MSQIQRLTRAVRGSASHDQYQYLSQSAAEVGPVPGVYRCWSRLGRHQLSYKHTVGTRGGTGAVADPVLTAVIDSCVRVTETKAIVYIDI